MSNDESSLRMAAMCSQDQSAQVLTGNHVKHLKHMFDRYMYVLVAIPHALLQWTGLHTGI